jgi:ElaB/YqjD/DUF883 family membrane-anchored ribosome-binding protein
VTHTTGTNGNTSHRWRSPRPMVARVASNPIELRKKREAKLMSRDLAQDLLEKQATVEDIFREVSRMKAAVTEAVEEGVESALRAVKQGREVAEDGVHSAVRAVRKGREAAEDAVQEARHVIKRNPLQAVGIVFAAGVVIGGILTLISFNRD